MGLLYLLHQPSDLRSIFGELEVASGTLSEGGIELDGSLQSADYGAGIVLTGTEDGAEVAGVGVCIGNCVEGGCGRGIILVQDLCEGGAVGLHASKICGSGSVVTFGEIEVAEDFGVGTGTRTTSDKGLCLGDIALSLRW